MCCERAHAQAADALGANGTGPHGDAAVAFVLKRRADAEAAGDEILAVLDTDGAMLGPEGNFAARRFGRTHAASAATEIAAQVAALQSRARVDQQGAQPAPGRRRAAVALEALGDRADGVTLSAVDDSPQPLALGVVPVSERYAAESRSDLLARLTRHEPGGSGSVRCSLVADSDTSLDRLRRAAIDQLERGETPSVPGVAFAEAPVTGELAFMFTGAAAAYPGAGRELLLAWPELGDALAARLPEVADLARPLYGAGITTLDPRTQLTGCALVCQTHAEFSRTVLGLTPTAAIGLSSGETNSLLAFGVWRDLEAMLGEIEASGMYGEQLTGGCRVAAEDWGLGDQPAPWECWRITAPRAVVEGELAREPHAYMTIVQAPDDCVIGGDPAACRRVIDAIDGATAIPLGLDMVIHCSAMEPFADTWRSIHTRVVHPAPEVRFYTNAGNRAYVPTTEAAAQAITQQAVQPIDFPATILQAWEDGVRVFVEHGPRAILTTSIPKILGDRPHLAVALDPQERRGLRALTESVSKLWVHGLPVQIDTFEARLQQLRHQAAPASSENARKVTLPAHWPDVVSTPEPSTASTPSIPVSSTPHVSATAPSANGRASMPEIPESYQLMPAAPRYPAALAVPQREVVVAQQQTAPAAVARPAAVSDRSAVALNLVTSVSEAHSVYVERQAQAHASFLKMRSELLTAARRGSLTARTGADPDSAATCPGSGSAGGRRSGGAPAPDPARPRDHRPGEAAATRCTDPGRRAAARRHRRSRCGLAPSWKPLPAAASRRCSGRSSPSSTSTTVWCGCPNRRCCWPIG